jgi:hypothetical protein
MTIKVVREPEDEPWGTQELCCFCWERTPYWYEKKDVPVCKECAKTHKAKEVPDKKTYCEQEQAKLKEMGYWYLWD